MQVTKIKKKIKKKIGIGKLLLAIAHQFDISVLDVYHFNLSSNRL